MGKGIALLCFDPADWRFTEPFESLLRPNPPLEMEETQELCLV